jgi:hypothetical protein
VLRRVFAIFFNPSLRTTRKKFVVWHLSLNFSQKSVYRWLQTANTKHTKISNRHNKIKNRSGTTMVYNNNSETTEECPMKISTADSIKQHSSQEERISLQNRLLALQKVVNRIQRDNSVTKVNSTITLGNMRLQIESIEEDKQILNEKVIDLKKKRNDSQKVFQTKDTELATLKYTLFCED